MVISLTKLFKKNMLKAKGLDETQFQEKTSLIIEVKIRKWEY